MKRLSYVLFGTMLAASVVACGPTEGKGKDQNTDTTDTITDKDKPTEKTKKKLGEECTPAMTNPCEEGLKCNTLDDVVYNDVSICMKTCTQDSDCGQGGLCGDDFGVYTGYCVDEGVHFGVVLPGAVIACPRDSVPFDYQFNYPAKYFYDDAGANDYVYILGNCVPICDNTGYENQFGKVDSCPTVALNGEKNAVDYDTLGINGLASTCEKPFADQNINLGFCTVESKLNRGCDDTFTKCANAGGRGAIQYDEDGNYIAGQNLNGVGYCDYDLWYAFSDDVEENPETGLYTNYTENSFVYGTCLTLCSDNAGCSDLIASVGAELEANQFIQCFVLKNGDDERGNQCYAFNKCDTDADCGTDGKCVNPTTDTYKIGGKDYQYGAHMTEKFCF